MSHTKDIEVRVRGVSRSYIEGGRRHDVIRNLDADFAHGETVALRGRSGSGKSTLLNLISGIDAPDSGRIEVAGQEINAMSERQRTLFRRGHIGFVYQAFNLVPTLTVADNIRLVLELNAVDSAKAKSRVAELLQAVGLADRADSYPDVLSGGEQQRVAIARALSHSPPLVIADEPTGNLDERTADGVLELLDRLVRQAGGTMIIATHSAGVAAFADRIMELHDGVLVG
jgi:putative ABC transport system ATP-binding protein